MLLKSLILCLICSCLGLSASYAADYDFVAIESLYEQKVGAIVMRKVYEKLGLSISIEPLPGKRAIAETISGRKHGEIMRIWTYGEEHKEVIRVPTPYYQLETMVFYKVGDDIDVKQRQDLKNYAVLKVRGVKHTNNITSGLEDVYDYDTTELMLKALRNNTGTLALTHTADGIFTARKFRLDDIRMTHKPLAELDLYHYVHRSQGHLVEKVDRVLNEMKVSGELSKVIKEAEEKVAESY